MCSSDLKVLKKDKLNVDAMVLNGIGLHQLGKDVEAKTVFAQAATSAAGANNFCAQYFYGQYLVDTGDFSAAMEPLHAAYKLNAEAGKGPNEALLLLLSRCCLELNNKEGVQYLQALRRFPDISGADVANNVGYLLAYNGQYAAAKTMFASAWAANPQDTVAPQGLAVLYDRYITPKNPREALSYYKACSSRAGAAGNSIAVDSYKSRIDALTREIPKAVAATPKPGTKTGTKTGATTGSKTGTKTTLAAGSKTGAKTTAKTGTKAGTTAGTKTGTKTGTTAKKTTKTPATH